MSQGDGPNYKDTKQIPAFGKDTPESALVRELLNSLSVFKSELHTTISQSQTETREDMKGLFAKIKDNADQSLHAHEITRRQVSYLTSMVKILWTTVKGSVPPPALGDQDFSTAFEGNTPAPKTPKVPRPDEPVRQKQPSLHEQVSEHDLSLQTIAGQMINVSASANDANKKIDAVSATADEAKRKIDQLLALQREQMGKRNPADMRGFIRRFGSGFVWLLTEREGHKFALALITAIGTAYAIATGHAGHP
jgi:predicted component of type VI protein secretion system